MNFSNKKLTWLSITQLGLFQNIVHYPDSILPHTSEVFWFQKLDSNIMLAFWISHFAQITMQHPSKWKQSQNAVHWAHWKMADSNISNSLLCLIFLIRVLLFSKFSNLLMLYSIEINCQVCHEFNVRSVVCVLTFCALSVRIGGVATILFNNPFLWEML